MLNSNYLKDISRFYFYLKFTFTRKKSFVLKLHDLFTSTSRNTISYTGLYNICIKSETSIIKKVTHTQHVVITNNAQNQKLQVIYKTGADQTQYSKKKE